MKYRLILFPRLITQIISIFIISIGLLTTANAQDVKSGGKIFKKCKTCHTVGDGAKNRVGPKLNDIIGRTAGTVEGYKYSLAMIKAGVDSIKWDEANLDAYLMKPKDFIPKTKMSFSGLKKETDRKDVIAYLATFSDPEDGSGEEAKSEGDSKKTEADTAATTPVIDNSPPEFTEAFLNDQPNIDAGKVLWFGQCTHCHGYKAYPGKAPKLKPRKYKPTFVYKRVFKGFKKMPGWKEVFSKNEIMQIVVYVKSQQFSP